MCVCVYVYTCMFCVVAVFVVMGVHMLAAYTSQMFVYRSWFIKVCADACECV